jgi:hypothetical protein
MAVADPAGKRGPFAPERARQSGESLDADADTVACDADTEAWGCPPKPVQLPFTNDSVLKWLLAPHDVDDFFFEVWERKPLHIPHQDAEYLKCIMTHEDLEDVLLNTAEDENFGEILTFKNQQQVYYDNGMRAYLDGKILNKSTLFSGFYLVNVLGR